MSVKDSQQDIKITELENQISTMVKEINDLKGISVPVIIREKFNLTNARALVEKQIVNILSNKSISLELISELDRMVQLLSTIENLEQWGWLTDD